MYGKLTKKSALDKLLLESHTCGLQHEVPPHYALPCRYQPLPTPEAEAKLLQTIHEMYAANVLPNCLGLITQDLVGSTGDRGGS